MSRLRSSFLSSSALRLLLIALFLGISLSLLMVESAQAEGVHAQGPKIHVVRRGETLSAIASRYGVSINTLMKWNSLRNANVIYIGQRLVVQQASGDRSTKSGIHVVRRGETLSALARRYGASVSAIRQANGLRSNMIYVGQRLKIPNMTSSPGAQPNPPSGTATYHIVRRGDTLGSIARRYGTTVQRLADLNGITNTSLIRIGQRLLISGKAPSVSKPRPTGEKKIVVDISQQRCYRYQGGVLLNTWLCSTGMRNSTKTGVFRVQSKLRKAYGSTWNIWMPYWLGIYWSGPVENGMHGLPWKADTGRKIWAGLVGRPATYGCVMLKDGPMKTLWEWADIGTKVVIRR